MKNPLKKIKKKKIRIAIIISILSGVFYIPFLINLSTNSFSYNNFLPVNSVVISGDGKYVVVGYGDYDHISAGGGVCLFDRKQKKLLWDYKTDSRVEHVDISENGDRIVAGEFDGISHLFERSSSDPIWSEDTGSQVCISADGEYIATSGGFVYKGTSKSFISNYSEIIEGYVRDIEISEDGTYFIVGAESGLYLFNTSNPTPLWIFDEATEFEAVDLSSNGKYIVGASEGNNSLYLFNRDNSDPEWDYELYNGPSVAISADGKYIVAGSVNNKEVYFFKYSSEKPLWVHKVGIFVDSVDISEDGEYAVAGIHSFPVGGMVSIYHKSSSTPVFNYIWASTIETVSISEDAAFIAAGGTYRVLSGTALVLERERPIYIDWTSYLMILLIFSLIGISIILVKQRKIKKMKEMGIDISFKTVKRKKEATFQLDIHLEKANSLKKQAILTKKEEKITETIRLYEEAVKELKEVKTNAAISKEYLINEIEKQIKDLNNYISILK